jgi:hypothetical protein
MRLSVSETGNLLRLSLRPAHLVASIGFAVLFIAAGLGVAHLLGRRTTFDCEARTGTAWCEAGSRGLVGGPRAEGPVAGLAARTEVRTRLGFIATRTLVVTLGGREVALGFTRATGFQKDTMAARIDSLARGLRPLPLVIVEDMRLVGWLFGGIVAAGGAIILLALERVVITVDRRRRLVAIAGGPRWRRREETVAFDEVEGVEAESFTVDTATSWSVFLRLRGDAVAYLTRAPLFTEASAAEAVRRLRSALAG